VDLAITFVILDTLNIFLIDTLNKFFFFLIGLSLKSLHPMA